MQFFHAVILVLFSSSTLVSATTVGAIPFDVSFGLENREAFDTRSSGSEDIAKREVRTSYPTIRHLDTKDIYTNKLHIVFRDICSCSTSYSIWRFFEFQRLNASPQKDPAKPQKPSQKLSALKCPPDGGKPKLQNEESHFGLDFKNNSLGHERLNSSHHT